MSDFVRDILKVAKAVLSSVQVKEVDGEMVVTGSYLEMKDIFPHLKKMGFRYNGGDRSWSKPLSSITDKDRQTINELIETKGADTSKVKAEAESEIRKHKFEIYPVITRQDGFVIQNVPYGELRDKLYRMGGKRASDGYVFFYSEISVETVKNVLSLLEEYEGKEKFQRDEILNYVKQHIDGKSWDGGGIRAELQGNIVCIYTSDKKYRPVVVYNLERAKWVGYWEVPLWENTVANFKLFVKAAEKAEEETQKEIQQTYHGNKIVFSLGEGYDGRIWFKEGDVIANPKRRKVSDPEYIKVIEIKSRYFSQDGMSFGVGAERGHIWRVFARPATDSESAELRKQKEEELSKTSALNKLEAIAESIRKNGTYPHGDNKPEGQTIYLNDKTIAYGGGEWFVVGPRGIWFVQNNGADGDDWSLNNVVTGGAGAIGWVVPYDEALGEEIQRLAEIAHLKVE